MPRSRIRQLRLERFEDRLTPDGAPYALDPSFGVGGFAAGNVASDTPGNAITAPDGRIWELTYNDVSRSFVARYTADGVLDTSLDDDGFLSPVVRTVSPELNRIAFLPDGRAVIAAASSSNGRPCPVIFRLTPDGQLDPTFGTAGSVALDGLPTPTWGNVLLDSHLLPDGSLLAAVGALQNRGSDIPADLRTFAGFLNGYSTVYLVRITPDGQIDPGYGEGGVATVTTAAGDGVSFLDLTATADGGAALTGARRAISYDPQTGGVTRNEIFAVAERLDAAGRPDPAFDGDGYAETRIADLPFTPASGQGTVTVSFHRAAAQADGGLVVAADLQQFGYPLDDTSAPGLRIVRFAADGQPDAGFGTAGMIAGPTAGWDTVRDFVSLPDGTLELLTGVPTITGTGAFVTTALVQYTADGQPKPLVGGSNRFVLPPTAAGPFDGWRVSIDAEGRQVISGLVGNETIYYKGQLGVIRLIDPSSPLFPPGGESPTPPAEQPPGPTDDPAPGEVVEPPQEVVDTFPPPPVSGGDSYAGTSPPALTPRVTVPGDLDGDGIADTAVANGPAVLVHLSGTDTDIPLTPFEAGFTGGVSVATADLDGDGRSELIVSAGDGGGGRVQVYALAAGELVKRADFFGIADLAFRGGATATAADLDGDGMEDLVVAAGVGGGPRVAVFAGRSLLSGDIGLAPPKLLNDFFAFGGDDAGKLRNGVTVAAADLNGDSRPDLVFGAGVGGAPRVYGVDGADLSAGRTTPLVDFFVGDDPASRDGTQLGARDVDGDGKPELIARGSRGTLRVYDGRHLADGVGREPAMLPDAFAPIAVD